MPRSAPQSVSCAPLPHPGRRDFPSPVGNEDLSRRDLPKRGAGLSRGVHAPVPSAVCRGVRRVQRFLPTTGGFIMPPRPRRASRPSSPRAPLLQERYPLSSLNMGPCADPDAPRLHFSFRPYRRRPRRLRHPRLVIGTVPTFGPALLSWSAASPAPAARQVRVTSSFPPDDIGLRHRVRGSASATPHKQLHVGRRFRGGRHSIMLRPSSSLALLAVQTALRGPRGLVSSSLLPIRYLLGSRVCYPADWPIAGAGLSPARRAASSAAPHGSPARFTPRVMWPIKLEALSAMVCS